MVRRYRAERLLRDEFVALRGDVLTAVRARLRARGVTLDQSDLEACYAQAWQGLYVAVLDGNEIESPVGWLATVTFRRAIDEHRVCVRVDRQGGHVALDASGARAGARQLEAADSHERDLAAELDDRARLRQLFEGLRGRLSAREREAAVLCYLQGLSRAQAAERMGVSQTRMRKLMEGCGADRPGVAGKVGQLVATIRDGGWCDEQGSLMRALAFGVLDPDGERYQLALAHRSHCPACRAYVTSLRGLAVTLPPVFLPGGMGAVALAQAGGAHAGVAAGVGAGMAGRTVASGGANAGVQAGRGIGGTLSASGAAGAGTAGAGSGGLAGGWLFAGGAKLAAGCLIALSVGAGCVALGVHVDGRHEHMPIRRRQQAAPTHGAGYMGRNAAVGESTFSSAAAGTVGASAPSTASALAPASRARREFGPEQALAAAAQQPAIARASTARVASSAGSTQRSERSSRSATADASEVSSSSRSPSSGGSSSQAEREFEPG